MEYALVLTVLVVGLIGIFEGLESGTKQEVANEFDCVSERPPPPSCQKRAVTTTTATTIVATTTTVDPATTTSTSTTTAPPATTTTSTTVPVPDTTGSWTEPRWLWYDGSDVLLMTLALKDGSGSPLDRPVTLAVRDRPGNVLATRSCETGSGWNAAGACFFYVSVPRGAGEVQVVVTAIGGSPPMSPPAEASDWSAPR